MLSKKIFKQNSFSIFIFHGVIKKNNYGIRNYNKKHILEKDFYKFIKSFFQTRIEIYHGTNFAKRATHWPPFFSFYNLATNSKIFVSDNKI